MSCRFNQFNDYLGLACRIVSDAARDNLTASDAASVACFVASAASAAAEIEPFFLCCDAANEAAADAAAAAEAASIAASAEAAADSAASSAAIISSLCAASFVDCEAIYKRGCAQRAYYRSLFVRSLFCRLRSKFRSNC